MNNDNNYLLSQLALFTDVKNPELIYICLPDGPINER